jgi:hypothetical protein
MILFMHTLLREVAQNKSNKFIICVTYEKNSHYDVPGAEIS